LPSYSLRGRIAETLREAILNGTLEEGQRLVERSLAAQLGASLTAVREALIELEMEGFIQKRRNASTYVTKLTLEDAEKIFAVRSALEAYAVEQAALVPGRSISNASRRDTSRCRKQLAPTTAKLFAERLCLA